MSQDNVHDVSQAEAEESERALSLDKRRDNSDRQRSCLGTTAFFLAVVIILGGGGSLIYLSCWKEGSDHLTLPRAIFVASIVVLAGVLLRFTDRMTTREYLLERIEIAKASAKHQGSENVTESLTRALTLCIETLEHMTRKGVGRIDSSIR